MTPAAYILLVLRRYPPPKAPADAALRILLPRIRKWAGRELAGAWRSGSHAKGTAIPGGTDLDLFISLKPNATPTLRDVYSSLYRLAEAEGWIPRVQNVSIGVQIGEQHVDLVPARRHSPLSGYHSLYRSKVDSWTQTNIAVHIKTIRESQRRTEIRLMKIWRSLHGLDFPSFYLELAVLEVLRGRRSGSIADRILLVLDYLADRLPTARIIDPANSNNIVSDDLTAEEKKIIALTADASRRKANWNDVLW